MPANDNDVITAACCGVRGKYILRHISVTFLYISPQPPLRSVTSENQLNDIFTSLLSVQKYSQLFLHESNTFLSKQYVITPIQTNGTECAQTHKVKT